VRREQVLALDLDAETRLVRERLELALEVVRHPLFHDQDPVLAAQELDQLLGDERVDRVEHQEWDRRAAACVGEAEHVQPAQRRVPETALHDDAQVLLVAAEVLVEPSLDDVPPRRRQASVELLRLHLVRERRQVDPVDTEARRAQRGQHADRRPHVVATP
jgi:hypothetical protein